MNFEDITWLFTCNESNRGIIRLNFDEAALLWKAVRATAGPMLEIGSRFGGSTVLMLAAGGELRDLVSIDTAPEHAPESRWFFERQEVSERLTLLQQDSKIRLAGQRFGLIFIDGDHSYEGVKGDVEAHWPNVIPGGLVAFHDAYDQSYGVYRVCGELGEQGMADTWGFSASMHVMRKLR